jgi:hypothetical protein
MSNQKIIEYIAKELARGVSEAEVKRVLTGVGWNEHDIDENIAIAKGRPVGQPAKPAVESVATPAMVTMPNVATETRVDLPSDLSYNEPKEKIGFLKKRTKLVVALVVALLLIGGAAYGAYTYIIPQPAKVLLQAQTKMRDVKSFDYSGKVTVNVSSEGDLFSMDTWLNRLNLNSDKRIAGANNVQFGIDFSGSADMTDELHPKNDLKVNLNASIITFGFNMRLVNDIIYVKVDKIPEIVQEAAQYAGVWMKVDPEKIAEQTGIEIDLQNGQPDLTDGQKKQLEDLAVNAHFFSGVTKLANDSIDGVPMYHYALTMDKAGLKNYILQVNQIVTKAGGFTDQITQIFDSMEFNNVEVWIGKSDKMIHRMSGIISEKPTNQTFMASGSLNFLMNFKNFNNASKIEAPTESRDVFEVIKEITETSELKIRDGRRLADTRMTQTALEMYYEDNGRYPKKLTDLKIYLPTPPTAPVPADGSCTPDQNNYIYTQKQSGQDYALTFCIGSASGGFSQGAHTASLNGIQ